MGKKITISEEEIKVIKEKKMKNKDKMVDKWLRVLVLRGEGKLNKEVAIQCECTAQYVSDLVREYKQVGLDAFVEKNYKKYKPQNMSLEEEKDLLMKYTTEANDGKIVEVGPLKKEYEEKVGHTIGSGQIYFVLKRHNWRKVKPRSVHPKKASEEVIDSSKKLTIVSKKVKSKFLHQNKFLTN